MKNRFKWSVTWLIGLLIALSVFGMVPVSANSIRANGVKPVSAKRASLNGELQQRRHGQQLTNGASAGVNSVKAPRSARPVRHLLTFGRLNYRMRVNRNANLYNLPKGLKGSSVIGSVNKLGLLHRWVNVNACANVRPATGFYRFNFNRQNYWILGKDLSFNLRALRGFHRRIERVISAGERLIGRSHYSERTRRYDCSSFMSHIFARAGVHLASTTYGQIYNGRPDRRLHRGDLIFFNDRADGRNCHVAIYLGDQLFLDDSPYSDNHNVDVASLRDPVWNSKSRHKTVHKFNHIIRKII